MYTKGCCPFEIEGDNGKGYFTINRDEERIQRVVPSEGRGTRGEAVQWTIQSSDGPGSHKVAFTSTNKATNVADAQFEGIDIQPAATFSFSDDNVGQQRPTSGAPKLVYFGGQWCPYCPPFTAKLKVFYEVLRESNKPIEVIFFSSDQSEEDFFDYFGQHHGDWFALEYGGRDQKSAMSDLFKVEGIPTCAVIGNDSRPILQFFEEFDIGNQIRSLQGNKQADKKKIMEIYRELALHYRTDREVEEERRVEKEAAEAEKRHDRENIQKLLSNHQKLLSNQEKCLSNQENITKQVHNVQISVSDLKEDFDKKVGHVMHAIYEATEVKVPSSFVILPHKIPATAPGDINNLITLSAGGSAFKLTSEGKKKQKGNAGKYLEMSNRALDWLSHLSHIGHTLNTRDGSVTAMASAVDGFFVMATKQKHLYLYLVDELTGLPIIPSDGVSADIYPIDIKLKDPGAMRKFLPMMRAGLKATSLLNGTAKVGRMFGFPCPTIPESLVAKVQDAVSAANDSSNIAEEFDKLNTCVSEAAGCSGGGHSSIRGDLLREFEMLLKKHDPTSAFCGLKRQHTPAGHALWAKEEPSVG